MFKIFNISFEEKLVKDVESAVGTLGPAIRG